MNIHDNMSLDEKLDKIASGEEAHLTPEEINILNIEGIHLSAEYLNKNNSSILTHYKEELEIPLFVTIPTDSK